MKRFSRGRDFWRVALCLFCGLWLLIGNKAWAQNAPPLTMSVDSPLSRVGPLSEVPLDPKNVRPLSIVARFGRWFPVAVTFNNTGEAVSGRVQLRLTSSAGDMGAVSNFVSTVDLPSNARKRIWLYGRIERGAIDGGTVTFLGRGVETQVFKFTLTSPDEQTPIALTISDSDERLAFISTLPSIRTVEDERIERQALNAGNGSGTPNYAARNRGARKTLIPSFSSGARAVETLGAGHEWVPTRWVGLDGVDVVVLHDFPHSSLAPEQLDALRDYAASGGTILVLGGANWQRLAQSPLREMWPLQPENSQSASDSETAKIVSTYVQKFSDGGDRLGGAPVVIATGKLFSSAQPISTKLAPAIAGWRSFGAGRVVWLAFDPTRPPFIGWSGQNLLWANIFALRSQTLGMEGVDPQMESFGGPSNYSSANYYRRTADMNDSSSASALADRLRGEMVRSPQLKTPPSSAIAWFLALYVFFLVPVNYVVLRAIDRRELAWLTVPLVVIVFSVLSFVAALRIKGTQVRQRQVNIVFGSNESGRARADSLLWLFSPRKTSYAIEGQNAAGNDLATMSVAPFADARRSDALDNSEIVQSAIDRSMKIEEAPINMWDYKTFVGHAVIDGGRGVVLQRNGPRFSVSNRTPFDWRGAVWIEKRRASALGDLKSGATATVASKDSVDLTASSQNGATWILTKSQIEAIFPDEGTDARQKMASAALSAALAQAQINENSSYLVAWGTQPVANLQVQNIDDTPQFVTLFLWQIDEVVS